MNASEALQWTGIILTSMYLTGVLCCVIIDRWNE